MLGSDAQGVVLNASGQVKDAYGVVGSVTVDAVSAGAAVTVAIRNGDSSGPQVFAASVPAGQTLHFPFPKGLLCPDGVYVELSGGAGVVSLTFL